MLLNVQKYIFPLTPPNLLSYFNAQNRTNTEIYINFALMNCGTFHAIFINLVNVTGLKP